jgi:glycosyltransferase involved in cell wall biosynthesis
MSTDRLVILTNIPSPYRTTFFNVLDEVFESAGLGLHVLYCALREPNRQWPFDRTEHRAAFTILGGFQIALRDAFIHVNPSVVPALRKLDPRWMLIGGAWHLPTMLLAGLPGLCPRANRILWTEGHADAVLNERGLIASVRRFCYSRYDAFAAPNRRSSEFAIDQAGRTKPVLILPNTVDEDFYARPEGLSRNRLRDELNLPRDARVLISVCQLSDRKGVVDLSRAFADASRDHSSTARPILVFAGEGERRGEIEAIARSLDSGEIRVLGHRTADDVRRWLWAADGFALATRRDPNPLSVIEASLAGLPLVLSSKAGNVDELVVPSVTGWSFDPLDDDSIAAALKGFLETDDEALAEMGLASGMRSGKTLRRRIVAERFLASLLETFPR